MTYIVNNLPAGHVLSHCEGTLLVNYTSRIAPIFADAKPVSWSGGRLNDQVAADSCVRGLIAIVRI